MQVIVEIPETRLEGPEGARRALEAFAIAGYKSGALSPYETRLVLGLTRYELDGFLKEREIWEHSMTVGDLQEEFQRSDSRRANSR